MARQRTIPDNTDWLRNSLRKHGFTVPLDPTSEQIAEVVASVPTPVWKLVSLAWRQRKHRQGDEWAMTQWHQHMESEKRLGALWEEFIARGFITREDALALAAGRGEFTFYSSSGARCAIQLILGNEAQKMRGSGKREQVEKMNAAAAAKLAGIAAS